MNRNMYKAAFNWVAPIVVVIIILTGEFLEGLLVLFAYIVFRFYDERDKVNSFFGKRAYLKGKYAKAVNLYSKAFKTNKAEPKVCISYCYSLILTGDFTKASEVLAIVRGMKDIDSIKSQILICENLLLWKIENRLVKAIIELEKAPEELKNTSYFHILGKMLIENNDMEKAKQFNEDAYRYNNKNEHILENLIRIYCMTEDYEKALKVIPVLMKQKPFTKNAFHYAGLAYEKTGDQLNAQKMYQKVDRFEKDIFTSI
ncbi:MAG: hypothetical protein JXQ23_12770 [Clostridia bacterium]|nr:hypothetical protein [Clostridia bacterium]